MAPALHPPYWPRDAELLSVRDRVGYPKERALHDEDTEGTAPCPRGLGERLLPPRCRSAGCARTHWDRLRRIAVIKGIDYAGRTAAETVRRIERRRRHRLMAVDEDALLKRRATHSVFVGATFIVCAPLVAAFASLVWRILVYVFIPLVAAGLWRLTSGLLTLRSVAVAEVSVALYLLHQLAALSNSWHQGVDRSCRGAVARSYRRSAVANVGVVPKAVRNVRVRCAVSANPASIAAVRPSCPSAICRVAAHNAVVPILRVVRHHCDQ